jgi:hypothetical protein
MASRIRQQLVRNIATMMASNMQLIEQMRPMDLTGLIMN